MSMNQMMLTICDTLLPSQQPAMAEGPEAMSQVIESSKHLPKLRGFREALTDVKGTRQ